MAGVPFAALGAPVDDEELAAAALAADPDAVVAEDAVCLWDLARPAAPPPLPEWYMPAPAPGTGLVRGWRRRLVLLVVAALLLINAYGLCSTYGEVVVA